ncbi:MAG: toprim domain-containing protein [Thermonemataceae bacterium]
MEIAELKSRLDIVAVARHLGIEVNKHLKAVCPFHDDGKPSLQFSREKQICTCFSSRCQAGTMDVISLTEKKLSLSTHEALKYLSKLAGEITAGEVKTAEQTKTVEKRDYAGDFKIMQSSFISSSTARKYATSRMLNWKTLNTFGGSIGYNAFKGGKFTYLRGCVVFGLRDEQGKVVSLYGRSVQENNRQDNKESKHFYTAGRKGLYPFYPKAATQKVILTESVIDAATLLSLPDITETYDVLALYGTNGFTKEHQKALENVADLAEVILWLDGDASGKAATQKIGKELSKLLPHCKITTVQLPENEDLNSLAQSHEASIFSHLLDERTPFLSSKEPSTETTSTEKEKVVTTHSDNFTLDTH